MKWRCTWCGKPHPENDPPCDNCGHGEFEKAVVPAAPESDDATSAAYGHVWVCTECGNDHPKNTPPCDRCGNDTFERQELTYDEEEVVREMLAESSGKGKQTTTDVSIGYLEVLDAKLALGFLGVGALVLVIALGALGVVDVPFLGADSGPVTAPGNATTAGDLSLSAVERAYFEAANDARESGGYERLTWSENLGSAAAYVNKKRVEETYADGSGPAEEGVRSRIGDACGESVTVVTYRVGPDRLPGGSAAESPSEAALAGALLDGRTDAFADASRTRTGVDVHVAPDGVVFVTQLTC